MGCYRQESINISDLSLRLSNDGSEALVRFTDFPGVENQQIRAGRVRLYARWDFGQLSRRKRAKL
jgi:hypothetical protein